jgi:phthalate 4,5-cis-dihydrodiol dehydrogenase
MALGVGIIGAGWWGEEHAKAVRALPQTRLVCFSGRSAERIARFQELYGVVGYDDYRRVLDHPEVEAVAIATPHDTHAALAIEALAAGKHVLLEKPMAHNRAECAAIADAARRSRGRFMLGLTHHFIPGVIRAREAIASGELGAVVSGFCGCAVTWEQGRGRPPFYLDRRLGGGIWMTLGVHFVDRLLWLIDAEVTSVRGRLARRFHSAEEQQADDLAAALIEFEGDATGTVLLGGYRSSPTWIEMQILGDRGMLRLDAQGLAISNGGDWRSARLEERNMMEIEWEAFAAALQNGGPMPISLEYALRVMNTLFDVEASSGDVR